MEIYKERTILHKCFNRNKREGYRLLNISDFTYLQFHGPKCILFEARPHEVDETFEYVTEEKGI